MTTKPMFTRPTTKKAWGEIQRAGGAERVLAMIERMAAESRQLMGDPINQVYFGLAFRGAYADAVFRKAARCLDAACEVLNADAARAGRAEGGDLVRDVPCGLRRDARGAWDTDYLALEYALGQDPAAVLDGFEAFAREHLRPRLAPAGAAA